MSSSGHSRADTMEEGAASSDLLVGTRSGDEPHLAREGVSDHPHIASGNHDNNRRGCFAADQMREMLVCIIFFGVSWILHIFSPRQRPIPYQYLEESNSYVRNLDHDELDVGDTVSDTALIFLAAVGPLVLQLSFCILGKDSDAVHATVCAYFTAFGLNSLATESVKLYVGYVVVRPMAKVVDVIVFLYLSHIFVQLLELQILATHFL